MNFWCFAHTMTAREAFAEGQASFERTNKAFDTVFDQITWDKSQEEREAKERAMGYTEAEIARGRNGFGAFLAKTGVVDNAVLEKAEAEEREMAKRVPLLRAYTVIDADPEYRRYMKQRIANQFRRLEELSSQFE